MRHEIDKFNALGGALSLKNLWFSHKILAFTKIKKSHKDTEVNYSLSVYQVKVLKSTKQSRLIS